MEGSDTAGGRHYKYSASIPGRWCRKSFTLISFVTLFSLLIFPEQAAPQVPPLARKPRSACCTTATVQTHDMCQTASHKRKGLPACAGIGPEGAQAGPAWHRCGRNGRSEGGRANPAGQDQPVQVLRCLSAEWSG